MVQVFVSMSIFLIKCLIFLLYFQYVYQCLVKNIAPQFWLVLKDTLPGEDVAPVVGILQETYFKKPHF